MDNQHRHIDGYLELTEQDIAAINELKRLEREVLEAARRLPVGGRWKSIGITHIEQGFMALIRCVARPEGG